MEGVCALITVQCYQMIQHFNTLFIMTQAYVFSHVAAPLNNIILPKLQMFQTSLFCRLSACFHTSVSLFVLSPWP